MGAPLSLIGSTAIVVEELLLALQDELGVRREGILVIVAFAMAIRHMRVGLIDTIALTILIVKTIVVVGGGSLLETLDLLVALLLIRALFLLE